jgi:hypothetical protein
MSEVCITRESPYLGSAYDIIGKLGRHSNPRRKWRALSKSGIVPSEVRYAFDLRGGETPAIDMEACKAVFEAMKVRIPDAQIRALEARMARMGDPPRLQNPVLALTKTVERLVDQVAALRSDIRALAMKRKIRGESETSAVIEVPKVRTTVDGRYVSLFDFVAAHFVEWRRDRVRREVHQSVLELSGSIVTISKKVKFGTRSTICAGEETAASVLQHIKNRDSGRIMVRRIPSVPECSSSDAEMTHPLSCQCVACT